MRRLTTIAAVTIAAVLALAFAGCDDQETRVETEAAGGGGVPDRPTIAVSIPSADHGWTGGVVYWANRAREDLAGEAEVIVQTAATPDEQISQIETLLARGDVDGMVVLAHESGPLTPVAKRVAERGVYLVNVDRGFTDPVADVYLAGDNAAFGRKSAEFVAQEMNGSGRLVILTGVPSTVDTERVEAAMEVFEKYPDIEVLDRQPGDWNRDKAMNAMQAMLAKHPAIDAVWAQDDDMAEGVEQAAREARRLDQMFIFGGAGKKEIVKRVMDGDETYPATITYPPGMIYAGVALASAHLNGGELSDAAGDIPEYLGITEAMLDDAEGQAGQKQVVLDVFLVTPENAEDYYFPDSAY